MSSQLESIYSDELFLLAETLGEVKTRTEKLEGEFSTHAKPLEAATNALSAALSGIKALQFHVLDNNLGALSARVEEMRKAVDEQVGVIALELKKADETNAAKAGAEAETLRSEIVALQSQLGSLVTQFGQQLERVEFAAKEEAKKLQLIPGPAGAAGASLNPRGTFIDGETYNRLDVVSWLGSSYIATVDGVKEKPSKNSNQWQTLASRGGGGAGGVGDFASLAGVAQINQGGTGQTTRALALNALLPDQAGSTQYMLLTDGSGTVSWGAQPVAGLPSQTSNSGRLLTTNGSTASWSNAVTVSGSNATVGGTLTVSGASGTIASSFGSDSALNINQSGASNAYIKNTATSGLIAIGDGGGDHFTLTKSTGNGTLRGSLTINNTTASTTTSSGALVVGNGTSGGLGVGGAIFAGGNIQCNAVFAANSTTLLLRPNGASVSSGQLSVETNGNTTVGGTLTVSGTGTSTFAGGVTIRRDQAALTGLIVDNRNGGGTSDLILSEDGGSSNYFRIYRSGSTTGTPNVVNISNIVGGSATTTAIEFGSPLKATATTASTSTSSGALVVSGGVGVAGSQYLGVKLNISTHTGDAGGIGFGTETNLYRYQAGGLALDHASGTAPALLFRETGTSTLRLETNSGVGYLSTLTSANLILRTNSTVALTLDTSQNAIFAGTVRTAAPSGGTAASWKLGSVATVSPTSPNRTIEVDIGGTIYYIHAKTTNN